MSAIEVHDASRDGAVGKVDLRLEVQIIPVSDVDLGLNRSSQQCQLT